MNLFNQSRSNNRVSFASVIRLGFLAVQISVLPLAAARADSVQSYSIFAGHSIVASGGITSVGGALGSNSDMSLSGGSIQTLHTGGSLFNVFGGITTTGDVVVDDNAIYDFFGSVGGSLNVGHDASLTANVGGNIVAGGNVNTSGNTTGSIFAGGIVTNSGTVGGSINQFSSVSPQTFTPLSLPAAHTFVSGGSNLSLATFANQTLSPGSYGDLVMAGSNTLNLSAGNYYFDDIQMLGSFATFNFDTSKGPINIFVTGAVFLQDATMNLNGVSFNNVVPSTANQVYWETHDNFFGTFTSVLGTVYAPFGDIRLTSLSNGVGNFVAGNDFITDGGTFRFGSASPSIPEPSSIVLGLGAIGSLALARGWKRRRAA